MNEINKESLPVKNMATYLESIRKLLQDSPKYRDSDNLLIARVWANELAEMGKDCRKITAFELLNMIASEQICKSYVIERLRRKLQAENPELRGEKWAERKRQEKEVKDAINTEL